MNTGMLHSPALTMYSVRMGTLQRGVFGEKRLILLVSVGKTCEIQRMAERLGGNRERIGMG